MRYLEICHRGVLIRFEDGSSVSFQKNECGQLKTGEYGIVGHKSYDEVLEMRELARREVLERGYQVIH